MYVVKVAVGHAFVSSHSSRFLFRPLSNENFLFSSASLSMVRDNLLTLENELRVTEAFKLHLKTLNERISEWAHF